jgi:hypothetical protein
VNVNRYNVKSVRKQLFGKGGKVVEILKVEPSGVELQEDWTVKCPPAPKKASDNCAIWLNVEKPGLETVTIAIYHFCARKPGCNDPNGGFVYIRHEDQVIPAWGIKVKRAIMPEDDVGYLLPYLRKLFWPK